MSGFTVPSGKKVVRTEDARQLLMQDANTVIADLRTLLNHPNYMVVNYALSELRNRGAL